MAKNSRINCPDCGIAVESKNLIKHYKKNHPDMDPHSRIRETKIVRKRRPLRDLPRSTIMVASVGILVALMIITASLFVFSLFQKADSIPDSPRNVFFTADDGAIINGTYYPALKPRSHTIYLIHDIGQDRTIWNDYALELQWEGYNVLAIDLRGHGESTLNLKSKDIVYDWTRMGPDDFLDIKKDMYAARRWVTENVKEDGTRTTDASHMGAMIGIGRGGLYAFSQAAMMGPPSIMATVIISPLIDVPSLDVVQSYWDYGSIRPFMLAASEGDTVADIAFQRIFSIRDDYAENGIAIKVPGELVGIRLLENSHLKNAILNMFQEAWELKPPTMPITR